MKFKKIEVKISGKLKKPHKFALIPETVRDRAKRTKICDHSLSMITTGNIKTLIIWEVPFKRRIKRVKAWDI